MTTLHSWLQWVSSTYYLHIAIALGPEVKGEPIDGAVYTQGRNFYFTLSWSQQPGFQSQVVSPALDQGRRAGLCSSLAPLGRQEECACLPIIAVNQHLPLLREKQQAWWCCPIGKADVWDEPALSCACLMTGHRKRELCCPHQGLKQRDPKQLVLYQFGPEYHS